MNKSNFEETIDFRALENELLNTIEDDKKYWRENDAKFRAVNQKVASYEEFSDIVKAAHLKPLDKSEHLGSGLHQRRCIWNSHASKKTKTVSTLCVGSEFNEQKIDSVTEVRTVNKPTVFCCTFNSLKTLEDKYQLLIKTGAERLGELFKSEIPISLFGQLLECLLVFPLAVADIIAVTRILQVFSQTKRFSLNLDFLTREEKDNMKKLMGKLSESLKEKEQDLAEEGVTEWTVGVLKQSFKV